MDHIATVLCGSDLSEGSDEALRQADAVARSHGAKLVVLHVLPTTFPLHPLLPHVREAGIAQLPAIDREALTTLDARVSQVTGRPSGSVELAVEHGIPYAVLVEKAESVRADLLVVGSRGATGLRQLLLGSVAERVARYAHSPVLVARASPKSGHVLVGTDFSDPALPAVAAAVAEARRRAADLTIVHNVGIIGTLMPSMEGLHVVPTLSPDYRQALYQSAGTRLVEALARFGAEGESVVTEGDTAVGMARLAETLPAELVVVGTSGTTGLRRMLLGSVAEAVVRIAPCSVLVVRVGMPNDPGRT